MLFLHSAEKNGQKVYLISAGTILWETSVEGNISEVNVNENGYVSIIIKNTTYKSVIVFYDLTGTEIFRRYISNNFLFNEKYNIFSDNH